MEIYVIRHGETDANKEGILQGWDDFPLNQAGIDLAEITGKALQGVHFDIAFTSPLKRARETAEIVLRESGNTCELVVEERIKEIHMGDLEGKRFRAGESEIDSELLKVFFSNPLQAGRNPGGEGVRDVMDRSQAFLKELGTCNYERVLVSTHGCATRCMLNFLYEDPEDFWQGHVPYNCAVNIVRAEEGRMWLEEKDKIYYSQDQIVDRFDAY